VRLLPIPIRQQETAVGIEAVGLRRLYDALGCSMGTPPEVKVTFPILENRTGRIYVGPKPPLGILSIESEQYIIPGRESVFFRSGCDYESDCFLEIAITFEVEVENSISAGLIKGDENAKQAILDKVDPFNASFANAIDVIAGLIGLKFHKQFVLKPLSENSFISTSPQPVAWFTGPWVENLQPITLTEAGADALRSYMNALATAAGDTLENATRVLQWLLKAWREQDPIARFLYLFIPLECVLENAESTDFVPFQRIETLRNIVSSSDREGKGELLTFFAALETKFAPTLNSRFESLAEKHRIAGWELDVTAFRRFNRIRNLLLHSGREPASSHLDLGEDTRTLEDLVERYVSLSLFGDPHVYTNQWRPVRRGTA